MPYRSRAQQGKFHAMLRRGDISPAVVDEFDHATDFSHLPARAKPKAGPSLAERVHRVAQKRGYRPKGRPPGT